MTKDCVIFLRDVVGAGREISLVLGDNNMYAGIYSGGAKFIWDDTNEVLAILRQPGNGSFIGQRQEPKEIEFIEYGEIQLIKIIYNDLDYLQMASKPTISTVTLP